MKNIKLLSLIIISSLFLFSCASKEKIKEIKTAKNEYQKAYDMLKDKRHIEAAEKFEAIYDDFPLSPWSIKAQTMAAYAYYGEKRYDDTIRIAQTFNQLNPNSQYAPYLQYMKAMSYFKMIPNITRAQDYTKLASYDFRELIARFPRSEYIKDARERILVVNEYLAGFEVTKARYQMKHQHYVGAIMHLNDVIYRYSKTKHAREAYFRLYEIYYKLGMNEKAGRVKQEMQEIYPDNRWSKKEVVNS